MTQSGSIWSVVVFLTAHAHLDKARWSSNKSQKTIRLQQQLVGITLVCNRSDSNTRCSLTVTYKGIWSSIKDLVTGPTIATFMWGLLPRSIHPSGWRCFGVSTDILIGKLFSCYHCFVFVFILRDSQQHYIGYGKTNFSPLLYFLQVFVCAVLLLILLSVWAQLKLWS